MKFGLYNHLEMMSKCPLSYLVQFFELQTPDFAWKFVWTVPTNYEIFFVRGVTMGGRSGDSEGKSANF